MVQSLVHAPLCTVVQGLSLVGECRAIGTVFWPSREPMATWPNDRPLIVAISVKRTIGLAWTVALLWPLCCGPRGRPLLLVWVARC